MHKFMPALGALAVALGIATVTKADIVYEIDQSSTTPEVGGELTPLSDTVVGTITTDGTIGYLAPSDIVSYDLHLNDNVRPSLDFELTPTDSGILPGTTNNGLIASATALSFNFSNVGALFAIQVSPGFFSGTHYFCFQAMGGPCVDGETIVPDAFNVDGVLATGLSGTVPLSGVPEPASWTMMLLGSGGLGALMRSRRRMSTREMTRRTRSR